MLGTFQLFWAYDDVIFIQILWSMHEKLILLNMNSKVLNLKPLYIIIIIIIIIIKWFTFKL